MRFFLSNEWPIDPFFVTADQIGSNIEGAHHCLVAKPLFLARDLIHRIIEPFKTDNAFGFENKFFVVHAMASPVV